MKYAIGQSVPRSGDPRLLKGYGNYIDDVNLSFQAHAFMLRAQHAHADILSIDTSDAENAPGVVAVLTGAEYEADGMGVISGPTPRKRRDGSAMFRPMRPALTRDRVRHVAQIVAVVIAESVDLAKDAAELINVDYTPLPVNISTEAANYPATPGVWEEYPDNESFVYGAGDRAAADAAIASAAHVVRQRFIINRLNANAMEPRGAIGDYDPGERKCTIYTGVQRPYEWRTHLAKNLFHVVENQIRIVCGDVGGSFGMKGAIYPEIPLVAWASRRIGRPVKWRCERSEGFVADDHARDNVSDVEFALGEEGEFLALKVKTNANHGAYLAFLGTAAPTVNIGGFAGVYTTKALHVEVTGVLTNTSPLSPYRGAGRPEASYILERMIDIAASRLEIDPTELRRRNLIPSGAMPYKTPLIFTYDCGEFETVMDKALAAADYKGFAERRAQSGLRGKLRGVGVSCTIEIAASPQAATQLETAEMRFDPSGTLTILVGTTPHGQGHETIYKQVVCGKLGLDPDLIRVIEGDTDKIAYGTGTGGSRSAAIGSGAVVQATDKIIAKTIKIAAHLLEASVEDITFEDGEFVITGTDRSMSFTDASVAAFNMENLPSGMEPGLSELAVYRLDAGNFPNGCHVCEVEIDPETGVVEFMQYKVVDDCGVELNPLLVKGQVHGGIAQGAGQALMENIVYDLETGQLLSGSLMDYAMPRADNFCDFDVAGHPVPTKSNILGVKGVGEAGTVGGLAAVMNAVNDALAGLGVEHLEMPATPERVWTAIRHAKGG